MTDHDELLARVRAHQQEDSDWKKLELLQASLAVVAAGQEPVLLTITPTLAADLLARTQEERPQLVGLSDAEAADFFRRRIEMLNRVLRHLAERGLTVRVWTQELYPAGIGPAGAVTQLLRAAVTRCEIV